MFSLVQSAGPVHRDRGRIQKPPELCIGLLHLRDGKFLLIHAEQDLLFGDVFTVDLKLQRLDIRQEMSPIVAEPDLKSIAVLFPVDPCIVQTVINNDVFNGIVEPCGVDTQVVNAAHVRHMSARYMLTGKDSAGQNAHIYVENNGWFNDLTKTMPFHTVLTFYTDSETLAPGPSSTTTVRSWATRTA